MSDRQGGSAVVKATGAFQGDEDVALDTKASYGDGDFSWLPICVPGAKASNALITFGDGDVGVSAGRGKRTAPAQGIGALRLRCIGAAAERPITTNAADTA